MIKVKSKPKENANTVRKRIAGKTSVIMQNSPH